MTAADPLRSLFPLTLAHAGEALLGEYRAQGGGDDPAAFCAFVGARFAAGTIPDRGVRDLARYELAVHELRSRPPAAAATPPTPAPADARFVLSDDVRLIMFGADLPGMLDALRAGAPAAARPRRAWVLLQRDAQGIDERVLDRDEGWLLEWFREPRTKEEALDPGDEEDFESLRARGVVVPSKG